MSIKKRREETAIVLSGGGARGAYEVGVVAGIVEVLRGENMIRESPFSIFTGTSIGAVNATYLASNADVWDMRISALADQWKKLCIDSHLKYDPIRMFAGQFLGRRIDMIRSGGLRAGRAIFNPDELETLLSDTFNFDRLHRNIDTGIVRAMVIAAMRLNNSRTTLFTELAPGVSYGDYVDSRRDRVNALIGPEHVLASAAVPVIFPSRKVGNYYYTDGGVRFNTPMNPAIRCGASRICVVTLMDPNERKVSDLLAEEAREIYPNLPFIAGKILNALLIDPIHDDLRILHRFNELMEEVMRHVGRKEMEEIERALANNPRIPRRKVETIVFSPSRDLGQIAHEEAQKIKIRGPGSLTAKILTSLEKNYDADLLSMLFFEGAYAKRLIDLGRNDALNRGEEVENFFGYPGIFYQVPSNFELGTWSSDHQGDIEPSIVPPAQEEVSSSAGSTVPAPAPVSEVSEISTPITTNGFTGQNGATHDAWIPEDDGVSPYNVTPGLSSASGAVEGDEEIDHHDGAVVPEGSGFIMPPAPEVATTSTGEMGIITTNGVVISNIGENRNAVRTVLHNELGISLAEADSMMSEEGDINVSSSLSEEQAQSLQKRLESAGAKARSIDVHGRDIG